MTTKLQNQYIGITMGCPVGIGPEIILKFFATLPAEGKYQPIVLGDAGVLQHAADAMQIPAEIISWHPEAPYPSGKVPVLELSSLPPEQLVWGEPDLKTGQAMAGYIVEGVRLAGNGTLAAIVTCPITKKTLNLAGYGYPGHTEMLAELTGTENYLMMMAGSRLRVTLVTIHEPLRRVPDLLTMEKVERCISLTASALRDDFGLRRPRIAVAGLNPHGGEHGMFGDEEERHILPAVRKMSGSCDLTGPWPPDTVFHRALAGYFDAVVAMYHDQGLIPFKLIHFSDGVNVTLGLPIVRTSVDHGTAYDIAGRGKADCASLRAAFELAGEIAGNRKRLKEK